MPEGVSNSLLNEPLSGNEISPEAVDFLHRRDVGVSQPEIEGQLGSKPPIVLTESRDRMPFFLAVRVPCQDLPLAWIAGKEILERRRAGKTRCVVAVKLNEAASGVVDCVREIDIRELRSELEGVIARQVRNAVLNVVVLIGEILGPV